MFKLIRSIFILSKIKRITSGQLTLQVYLNDLREELASKPVLTVKSEQTGKRVNFLIAEMNKVSDKIQTLEIQKKDLQLKLK